MQAAELDARSIQKAYARWAPIYDPLFGRITTTGRKAAVAAASRVGGRILEVGVGTGIALPDYGANCRVIGLDLSFDMLKIARKRVDDGLTNVEGILVNHFAAEGGFRAWIEKAAAPFGDKLGWHPDFSFDRVMGEKELTMIEKKPAGFGGLFTLVRFRKAA